MPMQLCDQGYSSSRVFGMMAASNATFAPMQKAVRPLSQRNLPVFLWANKFAGSAKSTIPLLSANHPMTDTDSTILGRNLQLAQGLVPHADGECTTTQADSGNICADLAVRSGIPGADFTNTPVALKATFRVSVPTNEDGSCKTYQVVTDENCDSIAA
ncbi:hypothetical protein BDW72DRAFT_192835 [Aspergillus terricola var. indicus]